MSSAVDPIAAEVFRHLFIAIAEEMGVTLERTAFSPNIKERRDHSCAIFDGAGRLMAQAAHIPVHLGAFPLMMEQLVDRFVWAPGDVVICNDPFIGGTHLPDISLVAPVFDATGGLCGFVANRAHHADIGGAFPGSMSLSTEVYQEGVIIPPLKLYERGQPNDALLALLCRNVRTPEERRGDLRAQLAAIATGRRRFEELLERYGAEEVARQADAARRRTEAAVQSCLSGLPAGSYRFTDYLDGDDEQGGIPISVCLSLDSGRLVADFSGTAPQQPSPCNATLAVTCSAVYYALICLLPEEVSINHGIRSAVVVHAPEGSLVNAVSPAAVAAGNVETSQRIVDVVLGALAQALPGRLPAASQGTMNNVTIGGLQSGTGAAWAYYETLGGGAGASPVGPGASGIHCHMSNTRNTPAEAMEYHYPLRVRQYALRDGSGGAGQHSGGQGIVREVELLEPATVSLLTDRRQRGPWGTDGGQDGAAGMNEIRINGEWCPLPGRVCRTLPAGTRLRLQTPGGGGWGNPENATRTEGTHS